MPQKSVSKQSELIPNRAVMLSEVKHLWSISIGANAVPKLLQDESVASPRSAVEAAVQLRFTQNDVNS
jgi:hypothetical protein